MRWYKLWLILLGISLIILEKYSFISTVRDTATVFLEKQISLFFYRITSYPKLVILNTTQQQQLAKQNAELKKQVQEYSVQLQQTKNKNEELKNVQDLSSRDDYSDFHQVVAKAILDVNFFVNSQMLIDIGTNRQVTVGNAIVNKEGVVGQVSSVNKTSSQLTLITSPDFKIYLQSVKSNTKMLAQGGGHNTIVVNYIDKNDKVEPGDILETTGLDDIYPANIPVAKVIKVFYENNGFNSALCAPVVNFDTLQYVLVLQR